MVDPISASLTIVKFLGIPVAGAARKAVVEKMGKSDYHVLARAAEGLKDDLETIKKQISGRSRADLNASIGEINLALISLSSVAETVKSKVGGINPSKIIVKVAQLDPEHLADAIKHVDVAREHAHVCFHDCNNLKLRERLFAMKIVLCSVAITNWNDRKLIFEKWLSIASEMLADKKVKGYLKSRGQSGLFAGKKQREIDEEVDGILTSMFKPGPAAFFPWRMKMGHCVSAVSLQITVSNFVNYPTCQKALNQF